MFAREFGNKSYLEYKKELIKNRQKGNRYYLVRNVKYPELKEMMTWPLFKKVNINQV